VLALAPSQAVSAANWKIDPARTHIGFAIDAVGYPPTQGEFLRFNGRISMDLEHTGRSSVAFRVQSQSVDVGSSSPGRGRGQGNRGREQGCRRQDRAVSGGASRLSQAPVPALKAAWIVHTGAYRGARSSPETATIATPPRKLCGFSA
jgi:hypothetical protein